MKSIEQANNDPDEITMMSHIVSDNESKFVEIFLQK